MAAIASSLIRLPLFSICLLLHCFDCTQAYAADNALLKQVASSHRHPGGYHKERKGSEFAESKTTNRPFILQETLVAVKTEAGEIRTLPDDQKAVLASNNVGLSFIMLEPNALLLPMYLNAHCLFLVGTGNVTLSFVKEEKLHEIDLEQGDIYRIRHGTLFYLHNPVEHQKATVVAIFDMSELQHGDFEHFFVAGGSFPASVLSAFDADVVATAMKVPRNEVEDLLSNQDRGPIICYTTCNKTKTETEDENSLRSENIAGDFLPSSHHKKRPFNVFKKEPDFENCNGRTVSVHGKDSHVLKKADIGFFAVKLNAGALLAPHWNPDGAELGVVTKGKGIIQVAFPNGTNALNANVEYGTLFYVPRYYPVCQIASSEGPFEFVGLTTSAKKSHPQFLAGNTSVLRSIRREVLASAFRTSPENLKDLLESEEDAVLLAGRR